jgi:hypothetical protein
MNQLDYISENDLIFVDRILRFGNLSRDFDNLAKEIGFEGKLRNVNESTLEKIIEISTTLNTKKKLCFKKLSGILKTFDIAFDEFTKPALLLMKFIVSIKFAFECVDRWTVDMHLHGSSRNS